jgi:predicted esterase
MDMSLSSDKSGSPSLPFIIEPSSHHTHSLIFLHGIGSNGEKFGKELIETGICGSGKRLTEIFPGARFIFPTSKRRRSSAFNRAMLTQWFDIASLDDPSYRNNTQVHGLQESYREVLQLVNQESAKVLTPNIILGGPSQGCAMALICLLAIDFPVGGFLGMSGWLPFSNDIAELARIEEDPRDDDPFGSDLELQEPVAKVLGFIRDLLTLSIPDSADGVKSALSTPIFLGHGAVDEKVRSCLGEDARDVMRSVGFQVEWRCYKEQGHWYKVPDEIDDIVEFLRSKAGWTLGN